MPQGEDIWTGVAREVEEETGVSIWLSKIKHFNHKDLLLDILI
jgi:ADP-ribose pyrophosphatase YjhB (NUDIX family)